MGFVLANKDGSSNAKENDIVVTGGGIYRKNAPGVESTYLGGLDTVTGKSGSYTDVVRNFGALIAGAGAGITSNMATVTPVETTKQETAEVIAGIDGFNPNDYGTTSTSTSGKSFAGYAIVALVGVVILDKLMK